MMCSIPTGPQPFSSRILRLARQLVTIIAALQISWTVRGDTGSTNLEALSLEYTAAALEPLLRNTPHPQGLTFMGQSLSGFWADQNSEFQQKIDLGYALVLSTPTGQSWLAALKFNSSLAGMATADLCGGRRVRVHDTGSRDAQMQSQLENNQELAKQLHFFWGLSLPLAQKIVGVPVHDEQVVGNRSTRLQYADGRSVQLFPKLYFFSRNPNSTLLDSYTAADNKTIVMVGDTANPDKELIGVLTHEAMITGDAKSNLLQWASSRHYRDLAQWQTRLADPAFNSILATMRAFRGETQVFNDLARVANLQKATASTTPRWQIAPDLLPYKSLDSKTCLLEYQRLVKAKYLSRLGLNANDRTDLLKYLDENSTLTRCDGTSVNACLEMVNIEAGTRVQNSSGPRPRVGNDW